MLLGRFHGEVVDVASVLEDEDIVRILVEVRDAILAIGQVTLRGGLERRGSDLLELEVHENLRLTVRQEVQLELACVPIFLKGHDREIVGSGGCEHTTDFLLGFRGGAEVEVEHRPLGRHDELRRALAQNDDRVLTPEALVLDAHKGVLQHRERTLTVHLVHEVDAGIVRRRGVVRVVRGGGLTLLHHRGDDRVGDVGSLQGLERFDRGVEVALRGLNLAHDYIVAKAEALELDDVRVGHGAGRSLREDRRGEEGKEKHDEHERELLHDILQRFQQPPWLLC